MKTFRGASLVYGTRHVRPRTVLLIALIGFGVLASLLDSIPELLGVGSKLLLLAIAAAGAMFALPSRIVVGADGVVVHWLWVRGFYPFARIARVEVYDEEGDDRFGSRGVALTMDDGGLVRLPLGPRRARGASEEVAPALHAQIEEAKRTQDSDGLELVSAQLERRGSTIRGWLDDLRAVGAGAKADHRTAPVTPAQLWRIVESHGADASERAAAAVALGCALDEEGVRRLRVARDAIGDDDLRFALDAAAREDDAALEQAMEAISHRARSDRRQ